MTASAEDVSVTRAIIKMAHGLQLQVVAEGRDSATRGRLGASMTVHRYGHSAVATRLVSDRPPS